jgi:hypothetical protein
MKKLILSVTAIAGLTMVSDAQLATLVSFYDVGNNSFDTIINGAPNYTQNLNLELLVGSGGTASIDVVTLLLSQTTASKTSSLGTIQPANGDITLGDDVIYDPSDNQYQVPASTTDYQVLAWTGNYSSYAAAEASGQPDVYAGETPVLTTWSGIPAPGAPPGLLDLDSNPIELYPAPEPSSLAMATVGIGSILVFGCRKFVRLG